MQSTKIDFLSKYNDLINSAFTSAQEFPNNLCDFLVNEYEFEAVVLARKLFNSEFEILGKSIQARKSLLPNTQIKCSVCPTLKEESTETNFHVIPECNFSASEIVMNEGCLHISISDSEKNIQKR